VQHGRHVSLDSRDESWRHRAYQGRKNMPLWQELPLLLIVAFCLAVLIRTFLFQAFFIPSASMENTLMIGDRVLVNKVVYDTRQPARGDIIVFRVPTTGRRRPVPSRSTTRSSRSSAVPSATWSGSASRGRRTSSSG